MYRPALIALLAAPALAQSPPPVSFPSAVELIIVDAVVVDDDGRPVAGLTRDDFVVKEDGKPQPVVSFESVAEEDGPALPAPAHASAVASNEAPDVRSSRAFVILLDDLGLAMRDAEETRRAVSAFLSRSLREGDEVVLGTTSGESWWRARMPEGRDDALAVLARLRGRLSDPLLAHDRMTEYEAFAINQITSRSLVLDRVRARWAAANLCREPMCEPMVRSRAVDLDGGRRNRLKATLHALRRAVEALAPIRGRKSLLFFSRGFVEDPEAGLRDVAAFAQRANAAVYFIDARGLQAMPGLMSASEGGPPPDPGQLGAMLFEDNLESGGAQALALETGGLTVRNTNDLAAGAERVVGESRVYYLLGFHPPPGKAKGEWRKLSVEVLGKGRKVRARRGYALGGPAADPGRSAARALESPRNDTGIPLRAMVYVQEPRAKGLTRVLVTAEFEAARLALPAKGPSRSGAVELSVQVTPRDGKDVLRGQERAQVTVGADEAPAWRSVVREFELPAGVAQVRVVVHEPVSGAIGSVSQRFEVPPPSPLRLSTPIVTNRLAPGGGERPRPALAVHRVFPPAGSLYCEFEVFRAASASGARVLAGFSVFGREGRLVRRAEPTAIAPDGDGRLVRTIGMTVDGWEEGAYDLVLDVRDEAGGANLAHRETFTLARDPS